MNNSMGKLPLAGLDKINDFESVLYGFNEKSGFQNPLLIFLIFNFKGIF